MDISPLELARERLSISELWRRRNWLGKAGKSCFVPYRPEDRREAGSVFVAKDGLERFKDFKSGETFDAPGLLARVEDLESSDACRRFIAEAGVKKEEVSRGVRPQRRRAAKAEPEPETEPRKKPVLPDLREPTAGEIEAVAELRGLSPMGVEFAAFLGLLKVARWHGCECWAVTDRERWNAQYRRFDGEPFELRGRKVKTLGCPGGWSSRPTGLPEIGDCRRVLLVEGVPDLLAAFDFIVSEGTETEAGAVCVTGASVWLPCEALEAFEGKRVRIVPHVGDASGAGEDAGLRWQTQLEAGGIGARCFDLGGLVKADGEPVGDLNDLMMMEPAARRSVGRISIF